jgi:N-acetylneuraminic acid mutarotase
VPVSGGSAGLGASAGAGGVVSPAGGAPASGGSSGGEIGGAAGTGVLDDPPPGEYAEREPLPFANSEMAVAETNGVIYVLGGYPSSREVQTTVQAYDIASDTWEIVAPLPLPLHHPVAIGFDGKVYSLGGQSTMDTAGDTGRSFAYDPVENEWTEFATMPTARGAGAGAVVGDVIYVGGGRPPAGNAFEAYDVSEDAWTELPPLPTTFNERNHLAAVAIGTKVYFAGGRYDGGGFASPMTDRLDVFDTIAKTWSEGAPMLRERGGVNGVLAFGCFHLWGGEGADTGEPNDVFPDHDVYDPRSDTWTALPDLPTPVHGVTGAAFVNGIIYMPGGGTQQGGSSGSRIFQVYRPAMSCE